METFWFSLEHMSQYSPKVKETKKDILVTAHLLFAFSFFLYLVCTIFFFFFFFFVFPNGLWNLLFLLFYLTLRFEITHHKKKKKGRSSSWVAFYYHYLLHRNSFCYIINHKGRINEIQYHQGSVRHLCCEWKWRKWEGRTRGARSWRVSWTIQGFGSQRIQWASLRRRRLRWGDRCTHRVSRRVLTRRRRRRAWRNRPWDSWWLGARYWWS